MTTCVRRARCRNGGAPPDCAIRICAREKGCELCSSCADLEGCTRFEWLESMEKRQRTGEGDPGASQREVYPEDEIYFCRDGDAEILKMAFAVEKEGAGEDPATV